MVGVGVGYVGGGGGGGRGNISIWGSGTRTEYRGAHYRQQPTTLCHSRGSHYLLFEETFCSKHFVILREITFAPIDFDRLRRSYGILTIVTRSRFRFWFESCFAGWIIWIYVSYLFKLRYSGWKDRRIWDKLDIGWCSDNFFFFFLIPHFLEIYWSNKSAWTIVLNILCDKSKWCIRNGV